MAQASATAQDAASSGRGAVVAYLVTVGIVLLLMILLGLLMMTQHAGWFELDPAFFYQVMTVRGTGMVGVAGISGAAIMWHFLSRHVELTRAIFVLNLALFVAGAVLILAAAFIGGFAAGWTFLYPLPGHSNEVWSPAAAATDLLGLTAIGVGFAVQEVQQVPLEAHDQRLDFILTEEGLIFSTGRG